VTKFGIEINSVEVEKAREKFAQTHNSQDMQAVKIAISVSKTLKQKKVMDQFFDQT